MKIERVPKQMPPKVAPSPGDRESVNPTAAGPCSVWEQLAPRLLHPAKLAIIEALLWVGEPMSAVGLAAMFEDTYYYAGLLSYHLKEMENVGVLSLVESRPSRGSHQLFFYFPESDENAGCASARPEETTQ